MIYLTFVKYILPNVFRVVKRKMKDLPERGLIRPIMLDIMGNKQKKCLSDISL